MLQGVRENEAFAIRHSVLLRVRIHALPIYSRFPKIKSYQLLLLEASSFGNVSTVGGDGDDPPDRSVEDISPCICCWCCPRCSGVSRKSKQRTGWPVPRVVNSLQGISNWYSGLQLTTLLECQGASASGRSSPDTPDIWSKIWSDLDYFIAV
jgi:hypothetical protein